MTLDWMNTIIHAFLAASFIMLGAYFYGAIVLYKLLNWFNYNNLRKNSTICFSIGIGLYIIQILILILYYLEINYSYIIFLILAPSLLNLKKISLKIDFQVLIKYLPLSLVCLIYLTPFSLRLISPPFKGDVLTYHLPTSNMISNGELFSITENYIYALRSLFPELIFSAGISLSNDNVVIMISFIFLILFLTSIYELSRSISNKTSSIFAILVFLSNTDILRELSFNGKPDFLGHFYSIIGIHTFFLFIVNKSSDKKLFLFLSGFFIGAAYLNKILSVIVIPGILMFFIFKNFNEKNKLSKNIYFIIIWLILIAITNTPYFLTKIILVGNPFAPYLSSVFTDGSLSYSWYWNDNSWPPIANSMSPNIKLFHYLIFPIYITYFSSDLVSPFYISFLPLMYFYYNKKIAYISLTSFFIFISWVIISPFYFWVRYLVVPIAIISIAVGYIIDCFFLKNKQFKKQLYILLIFFSVMNLYDYRWSILSIINNLQNYNLSYTSSLEVKANKWINNNIEKEKRIAILHRENYKLESTILENSLTGEERWILSKLRFKNDDIIYKLKRMNFKYFTIMKNFNYLFTADAHNNFDNDIILIYENKRVKVFEIKS